MLGNDAPGAGIGLRVSISYAGRMAKRYILLRPFLFKIIVVLMLLCGFDPVAAEMITLPGGFRLGSSLDDAKRHAASRGWQLVPTSPELPGSWLVKDHNIGIHVCTDTVASISQSSPGGLDDFAKLVSDLEMERGKPTLQVASFMAGSTRISTVDARFPEAEGLIVAVQFGSAGGKLAISTAYLSDKCADQATDR
jgi:hypothetical protein